MHLKLPSHSLLLVALLPIPKFIHKKKWMRGVLEDCLIHECLNIILEPLKCAATVSVMLSDPWGHNRYCFAPIASYIVNIPKAALLSVVGGKTSPITMAMHTQFGDPFPHMPCTAATTLAQLAEVSVKANPQDLKIYFQEAQKFHLNGVDKPFSKTSFCLVPASSSLLNYFIMSTKNSGIMMLSGPLMHWALPRLTLGFPSFNPQQAFLISRRGYQHSNKSQVGLIGIFNILSLLLSWALHHVMLSLRSEHC